MVVRTDMYGPPRNNPNNLRVIATARTVSSINAAAREGFRPLVKAVNPSPDIHNMVAVYQHRETGEIKLSGDFRFRMGEEYERVLPFKTYYPYSFPQPFAAYLVPPDLAEGERVWLQDVIEDIVAVFGNQGWRPRLECCEAVWVNGEFQIQFNPQKDATRLIG
jgi:hypothetical protein